MRQVHLSPTSKLKLFSVADALATDVGREKLSNRGCTPLKQQFPLGILDGDGSLQFTRVGRSVYLFAPRNKQEWIPVFFQFPRCALLDEDLSGGCLQAGENRVSPDSPEPVGRVSVIGLKAMSNSMPVASLYRVQFLRNFVTRLPAVQSQEKTAQCLLRVARPGEEMSRGLGV